MSPEIVVVGSYVQDFAFSVSRFPAPGETRPATMRPFSGGKGFNQAVAASRLGRSVRFVGALGEDTLAAGARSFSHEEGMQTDFEIVEDVATGTAAVVVDAKGENQIILARGANERLSLDKIESNRDAIQSAKALICQFEVNTEATRLALEIAKEAGTIGILNPAPYQDGVDLDLLQCADVLIPNEVEFEHLQESLFGETLEAGYWRNGQDRFHQACLRFEVPVVIVTLGDEGCFVSLNRQKNQRGYSLDGAAYKLVPAIDVSPIDTTGAGDAFNGGFASGIVEYGVRLEKAIRFATRVAGLSVEKAGAAPSMPRIEEL